MKAPVKSPTIHSVENFWWKHELGIQILGVMLIVSSAVSGIVWLH